MAKAMDLELRLEPGSRAPLYLQVAGAVVRAIARGRLRPGMALPGVRELAARLGVTVNTILAGLRELQAQGWLTSQERAGFFVSGTLPVPRREGAQGAGGAPGFDVPEGLPPVTSPAGVVMDLSEACADARLAPFLELGRAYQRGLRLKGPELMGSRDPMGLRRLREVLAAHLGVSRALPADPGRILILHSSSMAITLVAQALVGGRGGTVAVEDPGDPALWETLRQACTAQVRGLPVDAEGLRVEPLEALHREGSLKLLVLTPGCHFPTGARLSDPRRAAILELSRRGRFPILELDPEGEHLDAPEPLAALDPGQVLHAGSLSRVFAPALGVDYLVVPEAMAAPLARARQRLDWQGDPATEWALSELFLDGEMERLILRVRKACLERAEAVQDALGHALGDRLRWRGGAMGLWMEGLGPLGDPATFGAWIKGCQAQGLKLRQGRYYSFAGADLAATRLGFSAFTPEELQRAVAMMR
ncbi:aminotransferase-like domain-containing protein [Mesoterricola silvestris]|uniref:aminotransferase-like domain-containing protein n=1 Tax=Mesoterricola silvestris TaxID=2927979 RepID=UPI0029313968|nr:PLP-dependent aminotransferase family protein [Mesoterricola silvestris]